MQLVSTEPVTVVQVLADCSSLVGKMPPNPPVTACDHLYGLFWKILPAVRGMVPPEVDVFDDGRYRPQPPLPRHSN
jgi:hypothetical protein